MNKVEQGGAEFSLDTLLWIHTTLASVIHSLAVLKIINPDIHLFPKDVAWVNDGIRG